MGSDLNNNNNISTLRVLKSIPIICILIAISLKSLNIFSGTGMLIASVVLLLIALSAFTWGRMLSPVTKKTNQQNLILIVCLVGTLILALFQYFN